MELQAVGTRGWIEPKNSTTSAYSPPEIAAEIQRAPRPKDPGNSIGRLITDLLLPIASIGERYPVLRPLTKFVDAATGVVSFASTALAEYKRDGKVGFETLREAAVATAKIGVSSALVSAGGYLVTGAAVLGAAVGGPAVAAAATVGALGVAGAALYFVPELAGRLVHLAADRLYEGASRLALELKSLRRE